jgi:murein L,D-transpeptidase YafK
VRLLINQNTLVVLTGILLVSAGLACARRSSAGNLATNPSVKKEGSSLQEVKLELPLKDPRIVVYKAKRQLELYSNGQVVRTYRVGLGFSPVEDKQREGDGRTPEGEFYIFVKNPKSAYYLSLGVSYPNVEDAERGLRDRLITRSQYDAIVRANQKKKAPPQYTSLGGLIYIHGNGANSDWTLGCVALEDAHIRELYDVVSVGTPVTIKP